MAAAELDDLRRRVEGGVTLVVVEPDLADGFWSELLGVRTIDPVPAGEYFARLGPDVGSVGDRLDGEFAFVGAFRPLVPVEGAVRSLACVSIGFREHALVTEVRRGAGRVLVTAVPPEASPSLAMLVQRAIAARPASTETVGIAIVGY